MSKSPVACVSIWLFGILVAVGSVAHAVGNSTPKVLPFQGRATDASGNPINYPVTIKFRIYPPAGSCYIYEDTQSVTPNAYGIFSVLLGTAGNSTGPATSFLQVFNNNTVAPVTDSCSATYSPADGDWRRLELVIDGVALTQMQTIGTSAFAMSAELLGGKTASDFIQVNGLLDQTNAELLVNGGDVGGLHNHDARYARRDGSNTFSGNVSTSASIYATGAAGRVGIGTGAASADLHIVKTAPNMRLEATSSGGGSMAVDFYSGATQRGSVRANEGSDGLNFYSGTQLAISIDSNRASTFQGSIKSLGTVGLGQYTNAQEPALITALSGLGALATGTLWTNSTTNEIKYWDGAAAQVIATSGATVSSVTAGTGLIDSGTASDPNLSVAYGNAAGTALQGNQAFGGDVSGTALTIAVNQLKGYPLDFSAAPTSNQVLLFNGTSWVAAAAPANGITQINGQTAGSQTLAAGISGAVTMPTWNSASNNHALEFPFASTVGTYAGLVSYGELSGLVSTLSGKQDSLGYTPVNRAGDEMTGALTLAADPSVNLGASTKQYVDSSTTTAGANYLRKDGTVTLTGDWDLGGSFKITNVPAPTVNADAANKQYVDTVASAYVKRDGSVSMTGDLVLIGDPSSALQASTKQYVDNTAANYLKKDGSVALTATWGVGGFDFVNVGNISLASQKNIAMGGYTNAQEGALTTGFAAADSGRMWYNAQSNQIKYWDGSAVKTLGVAGSGITSLNGLAGVTQTLSTNTAVGTAPTWNSVGTDHELQIPLAANGAGVTAGLISNAELAGLVSTLSGKQAALGYAPLNRAGDAMTGALTLAGDPSVALGAATKQYVDNSLSAAGATYLLKDGSVTLTGNWDLGGSFKITNVPTPTGTSDAANKQYVDTGLATKQATIGYTPLNKAGDVMTGALTLAADPSVALGAATKQYVDNSVANYVKYDGTVSMTGGLTLVGDPTSALQAATKQYVDNGLSAKQATIGYTPLNKAGDSMTGALTLAADPSVALGAATKQYVDNTAAGYVKKDGSVSMAGALTLAGDPTAALQASTKQYVDNSVANYLKKDGSVALTANWSVGGFDFNNVGNISLAAQKNIAMGGYTNAQEGALTTGWGASDSGRMWYNAQSNQLKYWNGSTVSALGVAGSGLNSLNGLTGITQTLSTNTATGTAPTWNSTGTDHELQIPLAANGAGVTAGLISNAELAGIVSTLSGKQAALGYAPLNKAGDAMTGALTLAADPSVALGAATKQYVDNSQATAGATFLKKDGSVTLTGNWDLGGSFKITNVPTPTVNSDAVNKQYVDNSQSTAGTAFVKKDGSVTLTGDWDLGGSFKITNIPTPTTNSDASNKQYVDNSVANYIKKDGSVALTANWSVGGFDFNNVGNISLASQKNISMGGYTNAQEGALTTGWGASDSGRMWYNAQSNQLKYWNGSAVSALGVAGSGLTSLNGLTGSTQTFSTNTATGTAPAWNSTGTDHELRIPLAANGAGVTAGLISNAELAGLVSTLSGKQASLGYSPLNKAGDAMTGALTLAGDPAVALGAATKQYVDNTVANYLLRDGSVSMTGGLVLVGDPSSALQAATKQYVDTGLSGKQASLGYTPLNKAGDAMTGALTLAADPTIALGAATKQYVDNKIMSGDVSGPTGAITVTRISGYPINFSVAPSNNDVLKFNGTSWISAAPAATGITSFNSQTGGTQTLSFALSAAITMPTWNSASDDHQLRMPQASTAGTYAGLVSYDELSGIVSTLSSKQASLGYTPLNKAGDAMTGALTLAADPSIALGAATKQYVDNSQTTAGAAFLKKDGSVALTANWSVGGFDFNNVGSISLASQKNIAMGGYTNAQEGALTTGWGASDSGRMWYNAQSNQLKYWNGSTASALGVAGSGLTSLNGLSGNTQTFSTNTATGTAPAWNSTGTDHELRIPLAANGAGVTAGLISNAELAGIVSTLSGKQASLGYSPLNKAGDAMTGALTLAADPTIALGAATKQYVDNTVTNYLLRDGSVSMTGGLVLVGDPSSALQAATKQYVDTGLSGKQASLGYTPLNKAGDAMTGALTLAADPSIALGAATKQYVDNAQTTAGAAFLKKDGSVTLTGNWDLGGSFKITNVPTPTVNADAANKQYVDNSVANYLLRDGSVSMTGGLVLVGDPSSALQAATKQYVDNKIMSGDISGPTGAITVSHINGYPINFSVAPANNDVLKFNGTSWISAAPAATGITSLNGLSGGTQTFSTNTATGTAPAWNSTGTDHELRIPLAANGAGVTAGLISNAELAGIISTLSGKQASLGYTALNKAGDAMTGALTLAADPSIALGAATKQYVDNSVASYIKKDGSVTLTGNWNAGTLSITAGGYTGGAFFYSSDRRLKKNIREFDGLDLILRMRGVAFQWRNTGDEDLGLIAQEVEEVAPQLVTTNPVTGMKAVKYGNVVGPLIEATKTLHNMCVANWDRLQKVETKLDRNIASVKEVQGDVKALEKSVSDLKAENAQLRQDLQALKELVQKQLKSTKTK